MTNKKCEKIVAYQVQRDHLKNEWIEVPYACGSTDPYGGVALCEKCEHKRESIMERSAYITSLAPSNWGDF